MKRILFLIVCLMSFSAKADMDELCYVALYDDEVLTPEAYSYIEKTCERNNILFITDIKRNKQLYIAEFCRFDREINGGTNSLVCVLYSPKARQW